MKQKTFREYLAENTEDKINLHDRILYRWKNQMVINTNHGIDRVMQRVELKTDELKHLLKHTLDKIEQLKPKLESEILFFSRSLQQGFIGAIDQRGVRVVTFLPKGRSNPKPGTTKLVIEDIEHDLEDIIEID